MGHPKTLQHHAVWYGIVKRIATKALGLAFTQDVLKHEADGAVLVAALALALASSLKQLCKDLPDSQKTGYSAPGDLAKAEKEPEDVPASKCPKTAKAVLAADQGLWALKEIACYGGGIMVSSVRIRVDNSKTAKLKSVFLAARELLSGCDLPTPKEVSVLSSTLHATNSNMPADELDLWLYCSLLRWTPGSQSCKALRWGSPRWMPSYCWMPCAHLWRPTH